MGNDPGEGALVSKAKQGDHEAFSELLKQHGALFASVVRTKLRSLKPYMDVRQLGQEVLQEAYVTAWDKLDQYDQERGSFHDWVAEVVRNEAHDVVRYWSAKRRDPRRIESAAGNVEMPEDRMDKLAGKLSSLSQAMRREERIQWVRRKLNSLRPRDREVLQLHWLEDKPLNEVAKAFAISETAAFMRRKRAQENLSKLLESSLHKYLSGADTPQQTPT